MEGSLEERYQLLFNVSLFPANCISDVVSRKETGGRQRARDGCASARTRETLQKCYFILFTQCLLHTKRGERRDRERQRRERSLQRWTLIRQKYLRWMRNKSCRRRRHSCCYYFNVDGENSIFVFCFTNKRMKDAIQCISRSREKRINAEKRRIKGWKNRGHRHIE